MPWKPPSPPLPESAPASRSPFFAILARSAELEYPGGLKAPFRWNKPAFQILNTGVPRCGQAGNAIPAQRWRSLRVWFDIGNRGKKCGIRTRTNQASRQIRPAQPEGRAAAAEIRFPAKPGAGATTEPGTGATGEPGTGSIAERRAGPTAESGAGSAGEPGAGSATGRRRADRGHRRAA